MIHKITKLSSGFYQLDNNETPLDEESLLNLVLSSKEVSNMEEAREWVGGVEVEGSLSIVGDTGVIVDIYEVDYPHPVDPKKETQELAFRLDEDSDFITQHLFPGADVEDVVVVLQEDINRSKKLLSWQSVLL